MYHLLNDKDFLKDFRELLKTLWVTGEYSDITLVSDDLIQFKTHKLVICSQSTVLKKIANFLPENNPVVFLKGVNSKELNFLLEFLYHGQLTLSIEETKLFKALAESFSIAGPFEGCEVKKENPRDQNEITGKAMHGDIFIKETFEDEPLYNKSLIENKEIYLEGNKIVEIIKKDDNCQKELIATSSKDILQNNTLTMKRLIPDVNLKRDSNGFPQCGFCDFKAKRPIWVRRHENIHKGIKYKCTECSREYTQEYDLTRHIKSIHFPEKSKCLKCNREFASINSRKAHSCVRSFCDLCGKSFESKRLREHIKVKHEGKRYPCFHCSYKATQKTHLKTHMKLKHPESEFLGVNKKK